MKKRLFALIIIIVLFICGCSNNTKTMENTETEEAIDQWTITQYAPSVNNMSFYTIYNPQKGLIVVDGGYIEDASYVQSIILELGGHVDAWIISHPHDDHAGAFITLYPELDNLGITVDDIYTIELPSPEVCYEVAKWDEYGTYYQFLTLDIPELIYVHTGDIYDICGLQFEIISAFDEDIEAISKDYINDGSMMFKVTGNTESFLFCSDVGKNVSDHILSSVGEEKLSSDYIQMGHHGNGGLKSDFYEAVSPSVAFFDAPDWLMYDETGTYTTPQNTALMESLGSEIRSFNSAPNSIILN